MEKTFNEKLSIALLFFAVVLILSMRNVSATRGLLVTQNQSATPKYMIWNGSAWSSLASANPVDNTIRWLELKANPARNETILATLDADSDIDVQIWNGSGWSLPVEMTASASTNAYRCFDIGIMSLSGKVMVAYGKATAGEIGYRIWNGQSWSAEQTISTGGSSLVNWIRLEARSNSNQMMLVAMDANRRIVAIPWNGTSFLSVQELETNSEVATVQTFDVAYEASGDALIVWVDGALATPEYIQYWANGTWSNPGTAGSFGAASIYWIRTVNYPGTDRIMMCGEVYTNNDLFCQEWNGNSWGTIKGVDTSIETVTTWRHMDIAPVQATGGFLVGVDDSNVDYFSGYQCTSAANCASGTWSAIISAPWGTTDIGTDGSWINMDYDPDNSSRIFALMRDQTANFPVYKGITSCNTTTCTAVETANAVALTSAATYEQFQFVFEKFVSDKTAPEVTLNLPKSGSFQGSLVTFNCSAEDAVQLKNITLYGNWNGWGAKNSSNISGTSNSSQWQITLNSGTYVYNCYSCDTSGNCNFSASNYSFTVDAQPPQVSETQVNTTSANVNEEICINVMAIDLEPGAGIDKVWALITYPNGTVVNTSFMSDTGSCAFGPDDNIYSVDVNVGSATGILYVNTTYANDTVGNLGYESPWPNLQVEVIEANTAPIVDDISPIPDQSVTEASVTYVTFYVNVSDAQGYETIDTVNATFYKEGEDLRYNSSCVFVNAINATKANYSCTIGIWYWDGAGIWQVSATANDTSGLISEPYNESFLLLESTCFVMSPSALTWPSVAPGSKNQTSNNDPSLLNNTCNDDIEEGNIQIKALNLHGETNPAYYIPAENFTIDIDTGGSPPAECDGTLLQNNTFVSIAGASLPAGNNSAGQGQEQLYYCLVETPSSLISQTYSTNLLGSWIIRVIAAMVLIVPARRKKKVKQITLQESRLLEMLRLGIAEIKEKYNLTTEEIIRLLEEKKEEIPVSIFTENLGALEAVVKYMKEELKMNYSEIAKRLNRDERTIWVTYRNALKKKKEKLDVKATKFFVPISIFADRRLSILESLVRYLKEKNLTYAEIAKLLNRDQRNIWTINSRARKKLSKKRSNYP
ncbi:MAG: hypothetical protein QW585_02805 [Candidatus Pacearchaeota archaeon]